MSTEPKSLMIATPMYGGMCTGFYVNGLVEATHLLVNRGIAPRVVQIGNDSLIVRARNDLVRMFLETDCDHLMFIDADIAFEGADVLRLLDADKDVVCGLYPRKEIDWAQIAAAARAGHDDDLQEYGGAFLAELKFFADFGQKDAEVTGEGLFEVRHGATGFMLIKRQVFEDLKPHVATYRTSTGRDAKGEYLKPLTHEFFATSIDETGCLLSEDYHFCALWRKHGGKVYADPFIQLEHVGTYVYGGNILKAGANLK